MATDLGTCQNHIKNKLIDFIDDHYTYRKSFKQLDPTLEILLDKKTKDYNKNEYNVKDDYDFINDDDDTLYININGQAVMGGIRVGDEVEMIYNITKEENVASVAVNLTALQHLWMQRGEDGKEQSLELNSGGRAATYDMAIDYDSWQVRDGLLLLHSPKKLGDESPAIVDTFEIMQLTTDSLVLMNGNLVTEFERYN